MDALYKYKSDLINLGRTYPQKKFIESSFTRWYFRVRKNDIFPIENLIGRTDLEFANKNLGTGFDIPRVIGESEALFARLRAGFSTAAYRNIDSEITNKQLLRLKNLYLAPLKSSGKKVSKRVARPPACGALPYVDFEEDKNKLLNLYKFVGMNTAHLSVPPIFRGVELFGSPLNTHNKEYCSPFEIDKAFGSKGSFFDYTPQKEGVYLCNPPFDEEIIREMSERLLGWLKKKVKIIIICTIPVWDSASQRKIGIKDYGMKFEGFEQLTASKLCYSRDILLKNEYPYWDYYSEKRVPASHTHLIFMSNMSRAVFEDLGIVQKFKGSWKRWASS